MRRRDHCVVLAVFADSCLFGLPVAGGPPPLRNVEPLPLTRAPEFARQPAELVPKAVVTLPTCYAGSGAPRCQALGPFVGAELAALYRPTPYFAFGGSAAYGRAAGTSSAGAESATTLALALVARVYLFEDGPFDPYLEALCGWASARTQFAVEPGVAGEDAAFGAFGRAGGGVDWVAASGVKLGVLAGYSQLVLARGESCAGGRCASGAASGGSVSGGITAGVAVSVLLGERL